MRETQIILGEKNNSSENLSKIILYLVNLKEKIYLFQDQLAESIH